jgi:hypothetical protein
MKTVSPEMPIILVGGSEEEPNALCIEGPVNLEELRALLNIMHL